AKIRAATIPDVIQSSLFPDDPQVREQQRARWNIKPDDIVVGIFGRVIEWKGQREFVQAMLLAMDEDPRLIGMIVGDASDGTRAYFDEVKALIRESRHASRFVLTGYITEVVATALHVLRLVSAVAGWLGPPAREVRLGLSHVPVASTKAPGPNAVRGPDEKAGSVGPKSAAL